jgi:putative component of membrane protein insertase Oxa1/YidC/SpoIIIJ protein YidD
MTSFYLYRKVVTAFSSLMSRLMSRLIKLYQSLISVLHPAAVAAGLLDI